MKVITMNYSEYEGLLKELKEKTRIIEELIKLKNTIVIESKDFYEKFDTYYKIEHKIPKVICSEEDAKKFLQTEFDELYWNFVETKRKLAKCKKRKKHWWNKNT